jgi:hypothetical protein
LKKKVPNYSAFSENFFPHISKQRSTLSDIKRAIPTQQINESSEFAKKKQKLEKTTVGEVKPSSRQAFLQPYDGQWTRIDVGSVPITSTVCRFIIGPRNACLAHKANSSYRDVPTPSLACPVARPGLCSAIPTASRGPLPHPDQPYLDQKILIK